MFDVITFGSATKDIFLQTKGCKVIESNEFLTGEGICFSLGSKLPVSELYFTTGGGGTNSAATLGKQRFAVAYCGKIGSDGAGKNILDDLHHYGVDDRFVSFTSDKLTNHSVIIDVPEKDRSIFVYRGASDVFGKEDVDLEKLQASWFYLAPFSTYSIPLFYDILEYATERNIKVMANPGMSQLKSSDISSVLSKIDVLLLNMEEASFLTGIDYDNEVEIIEKVIDMSKGVVLITKGVDGVIAYSGGIYYRGKPTFPEAKDRTGAGDSFGAGFLAELMRSGSVKKAIDFGIANSTSCLQKKGAKHGLLDVGQHYESNSIIMGPNIEGLRWS